MLKNHLSLFFLYLSTLMMLGHGIVPHHHHGQVGSLDSHDHSLHHEGFDSHHEDQHLDHVFSNVQHGQKGVECISCPNIDEDFNNQNFSFPAISPLNLGINFSLIPVEKFFFDYQDTLFISNYFPPGGLRAPPVFS